MKHTHLILLLLAGLGITLGRTSASELFGNFHTMGVIADCPAGKTVADIGRVRVYLLDGERKRPAQDAVQVANYDYFASSLFFLEPGRQYRVLVEYCDHQDRLISSETLSGSTRPEFAIPKPLRRVEVNPGRDALQQALRSATPGTAIILHAGTYYEGDFQLSIQATPDAPVMIEAAPNEQVILDGSDPDLFDQGWESFPVGLWRRPYQGNCLNVCFEEKDTKQIIRACPVTSVKDLIERKSDGKTLEALGLDAAYFCDGNFLTVLAPYPDLARYNVKVTRYTRAFSLENCRNVVIDGLTIRNFGKGQYAVAVGLLNSSDVTIQRCTIAYCSTGVRVKGVCDRVLVQDNQFIDDTMRWNWGYLKGGGTHYHSEVETGCVLTDGVYSGRGLVIRYNRISGYFDGAHLAPESNAPISVKTHETDFYGNQIVAVSDDFIENDGHARNVRIFENRMENCLSGISNAQALDGPVWVLYNIIARSGNSVATRTENYEGYPVKTNGGGGAEIGSGHAFFYHNTSWPYDPNGSAFLVKSGKWKKIVFRNNIWLGRTAGFVAWPERISPVDMESDVVFTSSGPQVKFRREVSGPGDKGNGVKLAFIADDPKLEDVASGNYRLLSGSPCIDRGQLIPGINDGRFAGSTPDIGVWEHNQPIPHYGPRTPLVR